MTTSTLIRWGIIGCGAVAEKKSGPAFNKVSGSQLFGVMRRDEAAVRDYAQRHQVPFCTTSADELIYHPEIDAIYIATPPHLHKDFALRVAAAGKPCCVEKPMALQAQECQQMIAAFAAAQQPLFVAYYRRSLPRFEKIRELLRQNRIGELRHIRWDFSRVARPEHDQNPSNWRMQADKAGGGYFVDLACHGLDWFIHLCGDIARVAGFVQHQQGYAVEDAVTACWTHQNGVTANAYWNFCAHSNRDEVCLLGSKGQLTFSIFADTPITVQSDGAAESFMIAHPENIQFHHIQNMVKHLRGETIHPSLAADAIKATQMMDVILGLDTNTEPPP